MEKATPGTSPSTTNKLKSITLIAAVARNGVIGLRGRLPWRLPDELKYFKEVTMGKAVIMGRKTREAIGMALPGRQNIVISRNRNYCADGCETVDSLQRAVEIANSAELMVIGGGELYRLAMPVARRLVLTIVDCKPDGDTWFPQYSEQDWEMASSIHHPADDRHEFGFDMQDWVRT